MGNNRIIEYPVNIFNILFLYYYFYIIIERIHELSDKINHHFDSHRTKDEVGVLVNEETFQELRDLGFEIKRKVISFLFLCKNQKFKKLINK